jgi:acetaldehyde dehydrogenase (acetylating)
MIQFASAKNISATIRQLVEQVNTYIDCYIILNVIALKK